MLASTGSATNVIVWQGVTYKVITAEDGRQWLDRNLGAKQVATSSTDEASYGWLYQWGRGNDEHQYTAWGAQPNPALSGTTLTRSSSDTPGSPSFVIGFTDWRNPSNNNLWQGVSGINNPCPPGFRLPTLAEWTAFKTAAGVTNAATALSSSLKLPLAGTRSGTSGSAQNQGSLGYYWSSSPYTAASYSWCLQFSSGGFWPDSYLKRADGLPVRAIKN